MCQTQNLLKGFALLQTTILMSFFSILFLYPQTRGKIIFSPVVTFPLVQMMYKWLISGFSASQQLMVANYSGRCRIKYIKRNMYNICKVYWLITILVVREINSMQQMQRKKNEQGREQSGKLISSVDWVGQEYFPDRGRSNLYNDFI